MKLSQYDSSVHKNIQQAKVVLSGNADAYGANVFQGQGKLANAIGAVADMAWKKWQTDENDKVIDGMNEYARRMDILMNDEKNGLNYTLQGKNAERLEEETRKGEEKIRQDIIREYGISSQYAYDAFDQRVENAFNTTLKNVNHKQREEAVNYGNSQMTDALVGTTNKMILNPEESFQELLNLETTNRAIMAKLGEPEEEIALKVRAQGTKAITDALSGMIDTGDYQRAYQLIQTGKQWGAPLADIQKYETVVKNQKLVGETKKMAETWTAGFGRNILSMTDEALKERFFKENTISFAGDTIDVNALINSGRKYIGMKYELGGDGVSGTDCGKLMQDIYAQHGYHFESREADEQARQVEREGMVFTDRSQLKPGDMVFWQVLTNDETWPDAYKHITHVGMYSGDGNVIEAGDPVKEIPLSHMDGGNYNIIEFGRPMGKNTLSAEEKEAQKEKAWATALGKINETRKSLKQEESLVLDNITKRLQQMELNGGSPEDMQNELEYQAELNPWLKDNAKFGAMQISAKNNVKKASEGKGAFKDGQIEAFMDGFGYEGMATEEQIMGRLQTLCEVTGKHLTAKQLGTLQDGILSYSQGKGEYAVKLPDKKELAAMSGVDEKEFDDDTLAVIRKRYYEYLQGQGGEESVESVDTDELKTIIGNELAMRKIGHWKGTAWYSREYDVEASAKDMRLEHIAAWSPDPENGNWVNIRRTDGKEITVTLEDLKSILQDERTAYDL